jgi:hypothetical protein
VVPVACHRRVPSRVAGARRYTFTHEDSTRSGLERVAALVLTHEQRPEVFLSLTRVVRPTPKLQVLRRGRTAIRTRDDVVELDEAALRAPSGVPNDCALATVSSPDLAPNCGGHVPGAGCCRATGPRMIRERGRLLLQMLQQQRKCTIEDHCRITIRHVVS